MSPSSAADRQRERAAQRSRDHFSAVADIGEIPRVAKPRRKAKCKRDLHAFLTSYFPHSTGLKPFSDDHRRVIQRLQQCVLSGGQFAEAMFRGSGKTTIIENATLWATLYGHRKFVPLIGANDGMARGNLDSIKMELEENDLLHEDFPEVCHPIRCLEGRPQRCATQSHNGGRTHIGWTAEYVVLPTIAKSPASGAMIKPMGITASLRGMKHKLPSGQQVRPDLVLLDDPQTDESASSPSQVAKRLGIIKKSVLRLGGHNKKIAVVMCATVIQPDDVVDQILDQKKNPAWQSERIKMVKRWADRHEDLWLGEYAAIRNTFDPDDPGDQKRAHKEATAFYLERREEMDAGCQIAWEHCYDSETEASAIQHAYNILIDDGEEVFASECQNEPQRQTGDLEALTVDRIAAKVSGYARGEVPRDCETLTAFIDVQGKLLYWVAVGWTPEFSGHVLDYGTWPDQKRRYFTLRDARITLRKLAPGADEEGAIFAGLRDLTAAILGREWRRTDGAAMRIGRCLVDANWGESTDTVKSFCRQSQYAAILMPSHGRGIRASQAPIALWGTQHHKGHYWAVTKPQGRDVRSIVYDTNYWKKRVYDGLAMPEGSKGSIGLYKATAETHRIFAEHVMAETPVKTEANGRTVFEWNAQPGRDNHFFDGIVGSIVAASLAGVTREIDRRKAAQPQRRRRKVQYI